MTQTIHAYEIAALFSGDLDFEPLVSLLKNRGKTVIVFSTRDHIARELIRASDVYIPLT